MGDIDPELIRSAIFGSRSGDTGFYCWRDTILCGQCLARIQGVDQAAVFPIDQEASSDFWLVCAACKKSVYI